MKIIKGRSPTNSKRWFILVRVEKRVE